MSEPFPAPRGAMAGRPMKPDERLDLICLKGGFDVIRARVPHDGSNVVVRTGRSRIRPVAAEIFTLEVERSWIFGHTRHLKGLVTATRLEVGRLELEPLNLHDGGTWGPGGARRDLRG